ncbi:MAG: class I SAM-dependent methyltransferase [Methanobacteriota archaeon]|nr:MAG: class I SAM-dependent methyltransferase [Euryarchaeota archaeon]
MREIVKRGYEEGDYRKKYRLKDRMDEYPLAKKNIDRMLELLPEGASILDLGCGPGIPFDKYLVESGYDVTGIDISQKHIDFAKDNVPDATFLKSDMSEVDLDEGSFHAVLSLYAIFHIPKEEHEDLFSKIFRTLKSSGLALVTLGTELEDEKEVGDFIGSEMAWSSYTLEANLRLVEGCGFEILHWEEEGRKGYPEHHLWILARKS